MANFVDAANGHGAALTGSSCAESRVQSWRWAQAADEILEAEPRGSDTYEDTDVLHNKLDIEVLPETTELVGSNTMSIRVTGETLTEFTFRLRENFTITESTLDGVPITVSSEGTTTRVAHLDRTYVNGEEFNLTIGYSGVPEGRGFGSINFIEASGAPLVFSLSEPYYAYTWWPAKDGDFGVAGDNSDKATLEISITAAADLTSVANGLLTGAEVLTDPDRIKYTYSTDYELSTYLVFFSTALYNTWNETYYYNGGSMPLNFYITPDFDNTTNRDLWNKCADMLEVFGEVYGLYPFIDERYGIYYFGFGGGMEHQTLTGQGGFGEYLTAHELGHQWWGDMVTCRTWQDIWLNEGFASYSEALWAERQPGGTADDLRSYMDNSMMPFDADGSVYVPEEGLEDVGRIFSYSYTYQKAAWVLHMLRGVMGDDLFFDMITEYRTRHEYAAADTEDFIDVCTEIYGGNLDWFFDAWTFGTGAPTYQAGWDTAVFDDREYLRLTLEQTQLSTHGVFTMPLEIEVTTETGTERHILWNDGQDENYVIPLEAGALEVVLDPDSWILDYNSTVQAGYYPAGPIVVTAFPRPGDILNATFLLENLTLTFDSDIESQAEDFTLTGTESGTWALSHDYDPATQTVTLSTGEPLPPDVYILTAGTGIVGADSQLPLDGDIGDPSASESLPSGDGQPDGVLSFQFEIVGQLPVSNDNLSNENMNASENTNITNTNAVNDNAANNDNAGNSLNINANGNQESDGGGGTRSGGLCGLGVISASAMLLILFVAAGHRHGFTTHR